MCGIVGIAKATVFSNLDRKLFSELLYINALRGTDGTGIIVYGPKISGSYYKAAAPSHEFLEFNGYHSHINKEINVAIGHSRDATVGVVNVDNTHPFFYNNLMGVHNGTLTYFGKFQTKFVDDKYKDLVDSAKLYSLIGAKGRSPEELKNVLEQTTGAYSLVWADYDQSTLNFVRNYQRKLFIASIFGGIIWASEKEMIELVAFRNKINILSWIPYEPHDYLEFPLDNPTSITCKKTKLEINNSHYDTDPYSWRDKYYSKSNYTNRAASNDYSISRLLNTKQQLRLYNYNPKTQTAHGSIISTTDNVVVNKISAVMFDKYKHKTLIGKIVGINNKRSEVIVNKRSLKEVIRTTTDGVVTNRPVVIQLPPLKHDDTVIGPSGIYIDKSAFDVLVADGCMSCTDSLTYDDADNIYWLLDDANEYVPVCEQCADTLYKINKR